MRSSLDYAGFAKLCARSPIMRKIMRAHNHIIQRSLPVAVAASSTGSVAIRYVFPVVWMTLCAHNGQE